MEGSVCQLPAQGTSFVAPLRFLSLRPSLSLSLAPFPFPPSLSFSHMYIYIYISLALSIYLSNYLSSIYLSMPVLYMYFAFLSSTIPFSPLHLIPLMFCSLQRSIIFRPNDFTSRLDRSTTPTDVITVRGHHMISQMPSCQHRRLVDFFISHLRAYLYSPTVSSFADVSVPKCYIL